MDLVTSLVVAALPLLGGVHLDADSQGNGVLAWYGLKGDDWVVQAADVREGRPARVRDLFRTSGSAALDDLDVAPSGAAVACLHDRDKRERWRVRVIRRPPGGTWGTPVVVAARGRYLDRLSCGTGDAGDVTVAWDEGSADRAAFVPAAGAVQGPVTLASRPISPPDVEVAPDGSAAVAFTDRRRTLRIAERGVAGAWATRTVAPHAFGPLLAPGPLVGWKDDDGVHAGAALLSSAPYDALGTLAAASDGLLAAWYTSAPTGRRSELFASRGGPPVALGQFTAYPLSSALAADGTGAIAWIDGSRAVARVLRSDGRWSRRQALTRPHARIGLEIALVAAAGTATAAWADGDRLRLATLRPD